MEKPKITYPCCWEYKIIGLNQNAMREAAAGAVKNRNHEICLARKSRAGKYFSLEIKTRVLSEADRNEIFSALNNQKAIKIVL